MEELRRDRERVAGFGGLIMKRIAIAVVLSGLVAACQQQAPAIGEKGTPVTGELDYIDAVPIDENEPVAPVARSQTAAKKEEPEEEREEAKAEEAAPAQAAAAEPAAPSGDAATATRRANETTAAPPAASSTETPYRPN